MFKDDFLKYNYSTFCDMADEENPNINQMCIGYYDRFDLQLRHDPKYKKIGIVVDLGFIALFTVLLFVTGVWTYFNFIAISIIAGVVLLRGELSSNKRMALLATMLGGAIILLYLITVSWDHRVFWEPRLDQAMHFMMGWIMYHIFRTVAPKQSRWLSFLYAMLFEFGYETIEYVYGWITGYWLITDPLQQANLIRDLISNLMGSLFGILVDGLFFYPYRQNHNNFRKLRVIE